MRIILCLLVFCLSCEKTNQRKTPDAIIPNKTSNPTTTQTTTQPQPIQGSVVELSVRGDHSCARLTSGEIFCWGKTFGNAPTQIKFPSTPTSIVSGGNNNYVYNCAIVEGGKVACWGDNNTGFQFGSNRALSNGVQTPTLVEGVSDVNQLAIGVNYACALHQDKTVSCWGAAHLTPTFNATEALPKRVPDLSDIVSIAAGRNHTCAVKSSGEVFCWGPNDKGQLGNPDPTPRYTPTKVEGINATFIVAGEEHTCALTKAGGVSCWGNNNEGQLGNGAGKSGVSSSTPVEVANLRAVEQLWSGSRHVCARSEEKLFCWGTNSRGMLGFTTPEPFVATPKELVLSFSTAKLSLGTSHTCALSKEGEVFCWGLNQAGQLGDGLGTDKPTSARPYPVQLKDIASISLGGTSSCFLQTNGAVFCSGSDSVGQLGRGVESIPGNPGSTTPIEVKGLSSVMQISSGDSHSCAITKEREVVCWGSNLGGSLGLGDSTIQSRTTPTKVVSSEGTGTLSGIMQLSSSDVANCVVNQEGAVYCWGSRQGTPEEIQQAATPRKVEGLPVITSVGTGFDHQCALSKEGEVFCWGSNRVYQLGDGTNEEHTTPVKVGALSGVVSIAVSWQSNCALTNKGKIYCWGKEDLGTLGGTPKGVGALVEVSGVDNAKQLAAGASHVCALTESNVLCWGFNDRGQLGGRDYAFGMIGIGLGDSRCGGPPWGIGYPGRSCPPPNYKNPMPMAVAFLQESLNGRKMTSIAAGGTGSCVLLDSKEALCWGNNEEGQLGTGRASFRQQPARVVFP